jgi:hypothetical protein
VTGVKTTKLALDAAQEDTVSATALHLEADLLDQVVTGATPTGLGPVQEAGVFLLRPFAGELLDEDVDYASDPQADYLVEDAYRSQPQQQKIGLDGRGSLY